MNRNDKYKPPDVDGIETRLSSIEDRLKNIEKLLAIDIKGELKKDIEVTIQKSTHEIKCELQGVKGKIAIFEQFGWYSLFYSVGFATIAIGVGLTLADKHPTSASALMLLGLVLILCAPFLYHRSIRKYKGK